MEEAEAGRERVEVVAAALASCASLAAGLRVLRRRPESPAPLWPALTLDWTGVAAAGGTTAQQYQVGIGPTQVQRQLQNGDPAGTDEAALALQQEAVVVTALPVEDGRSGDLGGDGSQPSQPQWMPRSAKKSHADCSDAETLAMGSRASRTKPY